MSVWRTNVNTTKRIAEIERELNDLTLGDTIETETARKCYFILETETTPDGEYIPCIAVEGESGYYKTDWRWGRDIARAREIAEEFNAKMGITKRDATLIQLSTMRRPL